MNNDPGRPIYFYPHIPKTGGQSVREHFVKYMKPAGRVLAANKSSDLDGQAKSLSPSQQSLCDLVVGHRVSRQTADHFSGRPARFFTVLREPISRTISAYNWEARDWDDDPNAKVVPFERWFGRRKYNRMSLWLLAFFQEHPITDFDKLDHDQLFEQARDVLKSFWLVARLEDLERTLAPALVEFGVPTRFTEIKNVAGRDYPVRLQSTPELEAHIRERATADIRLYEEFCGKTSA